MRGSRQLVPFGEYRRRRKFVTAKDDIEARLKAMEEQRLVLTRQIEESENVLTETDRKIADFKRRQDQRMADEPIEEEHRQRISEAGNETIAP
jgi:hypothetical protein